ncbi:MAG TPA: hypothetical protein PL033_03490 [Candidatus Brocadiia bacterium]|nr:hypothetical protein [Candidatus Brocadiia bacterium]
MANLNYAKAEKLTLKNHPDFNEKWLQDRIAEDPSILGLGDLELIGRERQQSNAGRLDLLLADFDQEQRYEVEIMLGRTDESHIIRCIEYWDIEKRRYPLYDHCAVLVAEDITSRFLNVLGLFNGHIPMIAIQLNALQVGTHVILDFVKVMDRFELRSEEIEPPPASTDRNYWISRASVKTLEVADKCLPIINELANPRLSLNYNKHYIGLFDGNRSRNFVSFTPKKSFIHLYVDTSEKENWVKRLQDVGMSATLTKWQRTVRITVTPDEFEQNRNLIGEFLQAAVKDYQQS